MEWSTRLAETAALAGVGALLGLAALLLDPLGRLLVGAAALLALALAGRDLLLRPRLTAGPGGIVVRTLGGGVAAPWAGLQVCVRETRRWGLRSRLLELDTASGSDDDGLLVLLGRRDLGSDPAVVARALQALLPGGRGT